LIIVVEKKSSSQIKAIDAFKLMINILAKISIVVGELAQGLAILQLKEAYDISEGLSKERAYVNDKIKRLQPLLKQLRDIRILFIPGEEAPYPEIQRALNRSLIDMKSIRENMLLIWSMRNKGKTTKDIEIIHAQMKLLSSTIQALIQNVLEYVKEYNKVNVQKLVFKVKWIELSDK